MAFAPPSVIYKIVSDALWNEARQKGVFTGATIDLQDGYIHLSTAQQVRETAARYFAGQSDLVLVAIATATCGDALKWEPSRGGDLFPHLYATLDTAAILWAKPLPLTPDGNHIFPELEA